MPDPETKTEVKPDPELSQLAAQIEGLPDIIEGKDSAPSPDKPVSEGEPSPKGEGEPKGKDEPEDGGDGVDKGEQEDPLKDLAADTAGALKTLLEHPVLGPLLNKWLDRGAAAQVTSALERERPTIEADAKRTEAERVEDEHFSSMTQEQISEEIASDEEAATAYARYQQRRQAGKAPNPEAIAQASQIYSYASRVAAVTSLLGESELSPEVKETLKPDNFTHLKAEGIREWEKAVFKALVAHEAGGLSEKALEEKWEAYKEEQLAEMDGERPAIVSGRRDGPMPGLIETPSETLLERALDKKPKKGQ